MNSESFFFDRTGDPSLKHLVRGVDEIRLPRRPNTGPKENPCVRTPNQVRTLFYVGSRPQHSEFVAAERYKETITRRLGCRESADRSEERRVGKECRSLWSPYH